MPDRPPVDTWLDLWDELRQRNQSVSVDEFIRRHCGGASSGAIDEFRMKVSDLRWMSAALVGKQAVKPTGDGRGGDTSNTPKPRVNLAPGDEPIPGYRLERCLGGGGFGDVWRATGPGGFAVALKFVPLEHGKGRRELAAVERIKEIRHPHLLAFVGAWQTEGCLVIAMELAERTLADRLKQVRDQKLPGIPRDELIDYMGEAAKALDYLHSPHGKAGSGIQHQDIKPGNLLLSGGSIKVGDFGLAQCLEHSLTTHQGGLTLPYAAPEVFDGKTSTHSDQYSLAATYCELRGGTTPFQGSTAEVMKGHLQGKPDLSRLPVEERSIVGRALSKAPKDRWPSCSAFVSALREAQPTKTSTPSTILDTPRPSASPWWKRRAPLVGGALALLLIPLALLLSGKNTTPRSPASKPPPSSDAPTTKVQPTAPPVASQGTSKADASTKPQSVSMFTEIRRFKGHTGPVTGIAITSDNSRILSGGIDGTVRLWNMETGQELLSVPGMTRWSPVALTPNGLRALAASNAMGEGGDISLWDLASGKEIHRLRGHGHRIMRLAFLPSGRQALSGSMDETVRLWDLDKGTEVRRFEMNDGAGDGIPRQVHGLAVTSDGRHFLCGLSDNTVRLIEVASGREVRRFRGTPAREGHVR